MGLSVEMSIPRSIPSSFVKNCLFPSFFKIYCLWKHVLPFALVEF